MMKMQRQRYKESKLITVFLLISFYLYAQTATDTSVEKMIDASRAGASPLVFSAKSRPIPATAQVFNNSHETVVRGGLANFFSKISSHETVTVGYIGGSITQAVNGYRLQSAGFIQSLSPAKSIRFLNAGVSGTGTDLAACRLHDQLLVYQPDLIFIEFAVNGAYQDGLEGMIRQIIRNNPRTGICIIYTLITGQTVSYSNGDIPENIRRLEAVADYYQLPSIHLGMEAALLEKNNMLLWKGSVAEPGKILFSTDGVHPLEAGGDLYAAAIARGLKKIRDNSTVVIRDLPEPMFNNNWEDAQMLDPIEAATFSKGWKKLPTVEHASFRQFNNWFDYVMESAKPGASFSFKFNGTMFGFYDLGGPEVGQVIIELDGKPLKFREKNENGFRYHQIDPVAGTKLINRFNMFCNNRYRGQYEFIETPPGDHLVKVIISSARSDKSKILGADQQSDISRNPEKYDRTVMYLAKILLKGKLIR
jgi:lysophospholipase L1-like esterase